MTLLAPVPDSVTVSVIIPTTCEARRRQSLQRRAVARRDRLAIEDAAARAPAKAIKK